MRLKFGFAPGETVRARIAVDAAAPVEMRVDEWGSTHRVAHARAGRISELSEPVPGGIEQHDGSYTIDLLDMTGAESRIGLREDGLTQKLMIAPRAQRDGWGPGDYYMLERDADGNLIVEPGRNHRKIYVTASAAAYDAAAIAKEAGVTAGSVTADWLMARPEWGGTPEKALSAGLAVPLWNRLTGWSSASGWLSTACSHWLLFECGHDYGGINVGPPYGAHGESPLHPLVIGAWGKGSDPSGIVTTSNAYPAPNFVFRDISMTGGYTVQACNLLWSNIHNRDNPHHELSMDTGQNRGTQATLHRCVILDVARANPVKPVEGWAAHTNRCSGIYVNQIYGLLFEEWFGDHNGWADGYIENTLNPPAGTPQPPSMYSHDLYISEDNRDVCFVNGLSCRGASFGIMMRPGGYIMDTLMLDNNIPCSMLGSDYMNAGPVGNFGLVLDCVATSAGYKFAADSIGARNWGMDLHGRLTSSVGTIVCHMSNPDDPAEVARKSARDFAVKFNGETGPFFSDTRHFNWEPGGAQNIGDLDRDLLMQTTIQRYGAQVLKQPVASIPEYLAYLRGLSHKERRDELQNVLTYFRMAFGIHIPPRVNTATAIFKPDPRGEGFRWDNRLNWSTNDIPGEHQADGVDLHGNRVKFLRLTTTIDSMSFGGGLLEVSSGVLTVAGYGDAARVKVFNCGQYIAPGDTGDYELRSGRLAFSGPTARVNIEASGNSELILGPDMIISAGKTLRIDGGRCMAGWDGAGSATLIIEGTLDLRSTPVISIGHSGSGGDYPLSSRYRPGIALQGQVSGFTGIVDDIELVAANRMMGSRVRVRDMAGTPVANEICITTRAPGLASTSTLPAVGLTGTTAVAGVPAAYGNLDAEMPKIGRFFSGRGEAPPSGAATVILRATMHWNLVTTGLVPGRSYTLIDADTLVIEPGVTLPDGVTRVGNRLILTVPEAE